MVPSVRSKTWTQDFEQGWVKSTTEEGLRQIFGSRKVKQFKVKWRPCGIQPRDLYMSEEEDL